MRPWWLECRAGGLGRPWISGAGIPALGECIVGELSDRLPENGGWLSGNLSIASISSRCSRIFELQQLILDL